jgi:mannosidase alpha-like ER degradation enhancer 1
VGPHAVRGGQKVHVNDTLFSATIFQNPVSIREHVRDVLLFFRVMVGDLLPEEFLGMSVADKSLTLRAFTATFGADFNAQGITKEKTRLSSPNLKLLRDNANPQGCQPYSLTPISITHDDILVVDRGDCSFVEKLRFASKAGAAGVIVISDEDDPMNASKDPAEEVDDLADSGLVVLTSSSGKALMNLMEIAHKEQTFVAVAVEQEVVVEVQQPPESARTPVKEEELPAEGEMKYIYLGGKPIMNMIILV